MGANLYDDGETDEGAAFVYHGSAAGINTIAVTMVQSNQTLTQLGFSVACAGDVNADGLADVYIGGAGGKGGYLYLQNDNGFIEKNTPIFSACE